MDRMEDAERWAGFALDAVPDDATDQDKAKAYFRRARAKHALKDKDGAYKDYSAAMRLDKNDPLIRKERNALRDSMNVEKRAEREKYSKAFEFGYFGDIPARGNRFSKEDNSFPREEKPVDE